MKSRRIANPAVFLLLALSSGLLACAQRPAALPGEKLDAGIALADGFVPVFVRMDDQLFPRGGDYERFCEAQPRTADRLALREHVVGVLRSKADRSYAEAHDRVAQLIAEGQVRHLRRYWIVNGFACEATAAGCRALAELDEVGFVYRQRYGAQHVQDEAPGFAPDAQLTGLYQQWLSQRQDDRDKAFSAEGMRVPWNLSAVRADRAWAEHGVTGKGIVVAVLDDGMMSVPALLPALWANPNETLNGEDDDGNGYVDDVFGYNFHQNDPYAVTPVGHRHGTLCAGIIAARPTAGAQPIATGVAPRARVMPLVGSGQLRAYEYALENGADILSMSYTFEPTRMGQYRGLYRTAHEHLAAAGVVSVGGAGNYATQRPEGQQIGSPKDIPCVIAAAGIRDNGQVPPFSSRGPVSWAGIRYYDAVDADNTAVSKPDVTACNGGFPMWTRKDVWTGPRANRLREIVYEDAQGYALAVGPQGNSFAGPHAAGVAALMLEANPRLPVWHLQRLMEATCKDLGEPGRDTTHGAGMLQADRAVAAALEFRGK